MSRTNPYATFSNYNGGNSGNSSNSGNTYKNYDQYNQSESSQPSQPSESIKPLQGGIRPQGNSRAHGDQSLEELKEEYPQQPQQPQNQQHHRVREIESDKLYELLTNPNYHFTPQGKPFKILLKVYTNWCKPCQIIAPHIEKLSMDQEFSDVLFVQLDGEKISEKLSQIVKVSAVPVFFGFAAGKSIDFIPGPDLGKIVELCRRLNNIQ